MGCAMVDVPPNGLAQEATAQRIAPDAAPEERGKQVSCYFNSFLPPNSVVTLGFLR